MNATLRIAIAALAAGAAAVSLAQTDAAARPTGVEPGVQYVQEPIASTSGSTGANADVANAIAQALNAEAALKNSKLTVVSDESGITMRGVTETVAQMGRAMKIANQVAGDGKVANAINTAEVFVDLAAKTEPAEVIG